MKKHLSHIPMVDLKGQYDKIRTEINQSIQEVLDSTRFIGGNKVLEFQNNLAAYQREGYVIPCGNGTDALQIALMALDLEKGDEVIVPSFTYVATAEAIALLSLKPVMVDVDDKTFNVTSGIIEKAITPQTKAVVPVHLFGQVCDMQPIMELAEAKGIVVIEDNAQAIGAEYTFLDQTVKKSGSIGDIGTTSFFPSKNLGCYGDGGAIFTNDAELSEKLRMIANHGQSRTYYHDVIGCNSRLDAIQAAVLDIKLKYLDDYSSARRKVADKYDEAFKDINSIETPYRAKYSTHVFHQYVLKVKDGRRDALLQHLKEKNIGCNIYYPIPLYQQKAFASFHNEEMQPITEQLCKEVIALPIHTEMTEEIQEYVIDTVSKFMI